MYLGMMWSEAIICYYGVLGCGSCVCFPVGICCFLDAFARDIKEELIALNDHYKSKSEIEFYRKLCNTVKLHSTVKQLSQMMAKNSTKPKSKKWRLFIDFLDLLLILRKFSVLCTQFISYGQLDQFVTHFFYFKLNLLSLLNFFCTALIFETKESLFILIMQSILGTRLTESLIIVETFLFNILVIRFNFGILRFWREIKRTIWRNWYLQSVRLV